MLNFKFLIQSYKGRNMDAVIIIVIILIMAIFRQSLSFYT